MKIRKGTQLTLLNPKRAGRPALHDKGIRHIRRERINKLTSLHITIKVRSNKADIKSSMILRALHHAVIRARLKNLKIIHYTLEYNHVHLLIETINHKDMHRGMQAFGISFAKAINKIKKVKGSVYKHRYHLRKILSASELKNVLHYIFHNGIHHKRTSSLLDPYNSLVAEKRLKDLYPDQYKKIESNIDKSDFLKFLRIKISGLLDEGSLHFNGLKFIKS